MRGRPREFDREDVLARAMRVFWKRGYDATSISALVDAMGIGRQSIYCAFGGKKKLFEEALALYTRTELQPFLDLLRGAGSPSARLRAMVEHIRSLADRDPQHGCMAARTAASQCGTDPTLAKAAVGELQRLENALTETLEAAREQGELALSLPARALARTTMAAFHGLSVMVPVTQDLEVVDDVLSTLGALLAPGGETS